MGEIQRGSTRTVVKSWVFLYGSSRTVVKSLFSHSNFLNTFHTLPFSFKKLVFFLTTATATCDRNPNARPHRNPKPRTTPPPITRTRDLVLTATAPLRDRAPRPPHGDRTARANPRPRAARDPHTARANPRPRAARDPRTARANPRLRAVRDLVRPSLNVDFNRR